MEISLMLLRQIIAMICIALCGAILTKCGLLDRKGSKALSVIALYLAAPCSIINSFQTPFSTDKLGKLFVTLIAALLINAMNFCVVKMLCRKNRSITTGEQASVLYNNSNNLIVPLIVGSLGAEYVIFATTSVCVITLLMWSYGVVLIGGREAFSLRKMLQTPSTIAIFAGMALFLLNASLPGPIASAVSSMGNCIGPLSMLGIGSLLAEADLKKIFSSVSIYRVIFLRLLALPLLAVALLWAIEHIWNNADGCNVLTVTLLCAVGPSASTITQMAQLYDSPESGYISSINVATVMISMVSIPAMVFLFRCL